MQRMSKLLERKEIDTDVLIIGGGTAGCYAALTLSENSNLKWYTEEPLRFSCLMVSLYLLGGKTSSVL